MKKNKKVRLYPPEAIEDDFSRVLRSDLRKMEQLLIVFDEIIPRNRKKYYMGWGIHESYFDLDAKVKRFRKLLSGFGKVKGIYNMYESIVKDEKTKIKNEQTN